LPRNVPAWALIFAALEAAEDWFDPVRHTLTWHFGAPEEDTAAGTRTVTYLARQDGLEGKRLRAADQAAARCGPSGCALRTKRLRAADQAAARCGPSGCALRTMQDVLTDEKASWTERMRAVAQSSIVLSVFRDHVANAVFMKRGPQSALMEFFPHVLKNAV
ncbi:hypothetical protein EDB83DRAFT_2365686, partial [Lactarius deliciosus]